MCYWLNQYINNIYRFCFSETLLLRSIDSNSSNLRLLFHSFSQADRKQSTITKKIAYVLCQSMFCTLGNFLSLLSSCGIPIFSLLLGFGKGVMPALQKVEHRAILYSCPQVISPVRSLLASIIKWSSSLRVSQREQVQCYRKLFLHLNKHFFS